MERHGRRRRTAKVLAGAPQSTLDMALAAVPDERHAARGQDGARRRDRRRRHAVRRWGRRLELHYKVTAAADIDRVANAATAGVVSSRLFLARAWRMGTVGGFADTPTPRDGHTYINLDYGTAARCCGRPS